MIYQTLIAYLLLINLVTMTMFGIDKWKAKHNKWRIPEATLLTVSVIGGSIGAFCGIERKSTRLNSSHIQKDRMQSVV